MNHCWICEWRIRVNYVTDEEWNYTCNDCYEESIRDKTNDFYWLVQRNKRKAEKLDRESKEMWTYEEIMNNL
jgi:hypothetical protein